MNWIKKYKMIIFFIGAHLIFILMSILMVNIDLPKEYVIFDLRMFQGYDFNYANQLISLLDQDSLKHYMFVQIPLDMIYPLLLSIFFFLFFKKYIKWQYIAYLGFISLLFDYGENISVLSMLIEQTPSKRLVSFASTMTICKGIIYLINYGITIVITISLIIKKYKVQR